jgi:hypothetical protein
VRESPRKAGGTSVIYPSTAEFTQIPAKLLRLQIFHPPFCIFEQAPVRFLSHTTVNNALQLNFTENSIQENFDKRDNL